MNPVASIVQQFGGLTAMAEKLSAALGRKVPVTTVQYWKEQGRVPSGKIPEVIAAGEHHGIKLAPADFFAPAPARKPKRKAA